MSNWKEILVDVLKLTDEVKRLNRDIERIETHMLDVDKRLVRIETLAELTGTIQNPKLPLSTRTK